MDRSRGDGPLTGQEAGRGALSGPPGTQRHDHHAARAERPRGASGPWAR